MADFSFEILARDKKSRARAGLIRTRRGVIETPYLIPVGTGAAVRGLDAVDLAMIGVQCILANTYHLHLRPGDEVIKKFGGLHEFMKFKGPIVTDSGGYQVFSLGLGRVHNIRKIGFLPGDSAVEEGKETLVKINDKGVKFKSVYDGSEHFIDPKISMAIQHNLGADIIMAFDECSSPRSDYEYTKKAVERTHKWALESLKFHDKKQAIYGVIQGGDFKDLREESTDFISGLDFEGIAIGGSLGNGKKDMHKILDWIVPRLDDRPRHMLGIGWVDDVFECVERGVDTFDCVEMTRIARRGLLYLSPESGGGIKNKFRISIGKAEFRVDCGPIDSKCECYTCKSGYSRAYLRLLSMNNDELYYRLATIHNVSFMISLVKKIRESILNGSFEELKRKWLG